jgi:DNA repair photolyase
VHFTLTGWYEVEHRAPGIDQGLELLGSAVEAFGVDNVTWRFSPVPTVEDTVQRFTKIASKAESFGFQRVYLSFLQRNDWEEETRTSEQRCELLARLAASTNLDLILCNEDQATLASSRPERVRSGVCEDASRFHSKSRAEGCGCSLAVDPFSMNEACSMACLYCYSANRASAPKKRNTTKLTVIRDPKA